MMNAEELIKELTDITRDNIVRVQAFKDIPMEALQCKKTAQSWSVLECVEHLNRYGDFYIPEIGRQIAKSKYVKSGVFRPGLLGNYFSNAMLPRQKLNKMKTFQNMNPLNSSLGITVLDIFVDQQQQLLRLLDQAQNTDLTRVKTSISISKWIKLRLGDTFRVVVYHNIRHIVQAENVIK